MTDEELAAFLYLTIEEARRYRERQSERHLAALDRMRDVIALIEAGIYPPNVLVDPPRRRE